MLRISILENEERPAQVIYFAIIAFFIILSYPFTRTSAAPFFNAAYGKEMLPLGMTASAIMSLAAVVIYNELAKRVKLILLSLFTIIFIIIANATFALVLAAPYPKWVALLYYGWSDTYILIIVEQFWSISNTLFTKKRAKKYYGLFLTVSSVGGIIGNYLVNALAEKIGSAHLIFLNCIPLTIVAFAISILNTTITKSSQLRYKFKIEKYIADRSFVGGLTLVSRERYLLFITLLVASTQFYINAAYNAFNYNLANLTNVLDKQSAIYGKAFMIVEALTIFTGLVITPIALKLMDIKTHYAIILVPFAISLGAFVTPNVAFITALFIAAKALDYSIFRAAKELFYLPLSIAEKFQAKSFIDVFTYRFAKAFAAGALFVAFELIHPSSTLWYNRISLALIAIGIAAWFWLIYRIIDIYKRRYNPPLP